jgi:hypothetical protein
MLLLVNFGQWRYSMTCSDQLTTTVDVDGGGRLFKQPNNQ